MIESGKVVRQDKLSLGWAQMQEKDWRERSFSSLEDKCQWIARLGVSRKWEAKRLSVQHLLQLWSAFQHRQQTDSPRAKLDNPPQILQTLKICLGKAMTWKIPCERFRSKSEVIFYIRELSLIITFYHSSLFSLSGINIKQIWQLLYTSSSLSLCLSLSIFLKGLGFLLGVVLFTFSLFDF